MHVIHLSSVAVSREHKRAKTDRLDTAMLMRVHLGWLLGEHGHCKMVVPTLAEEDAKRPSREHEVLIGECTRAVNRLKAALARLGIAASIRSCARPRGVWRHCERRKANRSRRRCLRNES